MNKLITVKKVIPFKNHKLQILFSTNEWKEFDFSPLLTKTVFIPLKNIDLFMQAKVMMMTVCWQNGEIDIAPMKLYEDAKTLEHLY